MIAWPLRGSVGTGVKGGNAEEASTAETSSLASVIASAHSTCGRNSGAGRGRSTVIAARPTTRSLERVGPLATTMRRRCSCSRIRAKRSGVKNSRIAP